MSQRAAPRSARGAPARRQSARARPPARTRRASIGSQLSAAVGALPLPVGFLKGVRNWTLGLLLAIGLVAGLVVMGVPQTIGLATSHALGAAGFQVRNIQIDGRAHVDRDAVYRVVMDARGQDMPLVDLAGMRRSLLDLAWVQDARVSRRLPDTLVIDIVERRPAGIWQYRQRLALIDAQGGVIAPVDAMTMPDQLPLVIGPEANRHATELAALIATQPALKPLIEGASWIGGRRWDVLFQSGETLALPEGDAPARAALALFARKDSQARLLGQGIVRFDMRDPSRIVVRMSREPGSRVDQPDAGKNI